MPKKILIVSGEPSGDLHAANLANDLKSLKSDLEFYGIGGDRSKKAGVDTVFDISKLALVAVIEVLRHISVIKKAHDTLIERVKKERPDLAILVDYPGFNLKLAADLSKMNIPVAYYISPQIWAWAPQRINIIKKHVKKMVVFFKFEEELYKSNGVDAEFVGHPLLDTVKVTSQKADVLKKYNLSDKKKIITILPGSRINELKVLLPILLASAEIIDKKIGNVQFLISKHSNRPIEMYDNIIKRYKLDYRLVESDLHNIVAASDFVLSVSGTATLETTIIGTPYILIYKANLVSYILYNLVVINRFFGIANILAKREIAPEFLQYKATPENIANKAIELISSPEKLAQMRSDFLKIKESLGEPGASLRAARAILPMLH